MAKTTITFRLSDEEKIELENYADENDLSVSQVIRKAIKEFMDRQDKDMDI